MESLFLGPVMNDISLTLLISETDISDQLEGNVA